ncbi:hypothetical protein C8F04DRAFT_1178315 [Mycena alexandri]|uniref:Uncharacterized protein n=1 Tax=Mycena alexandri TaxID=1745969 RepID=A0AAD6T6E1_9AGAR|nr:hypothetical protein C8F04DRAFT_1178315 [Mycena alexandri]
MALKHKVKLDDVATSISSLRYTAGGQQTVLRIDGQQKHDRRPKHPRFSRLSGAWWSMDVTVRSKKTVHINRTLNGPSKTLSVSNLIRTRGVEPRSASYKGVSEYSKPGIRCVKHTMSDILIPTRGLTKMNTLELPREARGVPYTTSDFFQYSYTWSPKIDREPRDVPHTTSEFFASFYPAATYSLDAPDAGSRTPCRELWIFVPLVGCVSKVQQDQDPPVTFGRGGVEPRSESLTRILILPDGAAKSSGLQHGPCCMTESVHRAPRCGSGKEGGPARSTLHVLVPVYRSIAESLTGNRLKSLPLLARGETQLESYSGVGRRNLRATRTTLLRDGAIGVRSRITAKVRFWSFGVFFVLRIFVLRRIRDDSKSTPRDGWSLLFELKPWKARTMKLKSHEDQVAELDQTTYGPTLTHTTCDTSPVHTHVSSDATPTGACSNSSRAEYRLPGRKSVRPAAASVRHKPPSRLRADSHVGLFAHSPALCKTGIYLDVESLGRKPSIRELMPMPTSRRIRLRANDTLSSLLPSPFTLPRVLRGFRSFAGTCLSPHPTARDIATIALHLRMRASLNIGVNGSMRLAGVLRSLLSQYTGTKMGLEMEMDVDTDMKGGAEQNRAGCADDDLRRSKRRGSRGVSVPPPLTQASGGGEQEGMMGSPWRALHPPPTDPHAHEPRSSSFSNAYRVRPPKLAHIPLVLLTSAHADDTEMLVAYRCLQACAPHPALVEASCAYLFRACTSSPYALVRPRAQGPISPRTQDVLRNITTRKFCGTWSEKGGEIAVHFARTTHVPPVTSARSACPPLFRPVSLYSTHQMHPGRRTLNIAPLAGLRDPGIGVAKPWLPLRSFPHLLRWLTGTGFPAPHRTPGTVSRPA